MAVSVVDDAFMGDWEALYIRRYNRHIDELKWLYMELYSNEAMFSELCYEMHTFFIERENALKNIDMFRQNHSDWYREKSMIGMQIDVERFCENIKGLTQNMEYIQKNNVNFVRLSSFFEGTLQEMYPQHAVSDYRKIRENMGTMDNFKDFTAICREKDIHVCIPLILNATSKEHEWAKKAVLGDKEYEGRYDLVETGAVLWRLNYKNPRVLNEMIGNFLFWVNAGADVVCLQGIEKILTEGAGKSQDSDSEKVHTVLRIIRIISEVVCPGVLLLADVNAGMEQGIKYFGIPEKPEVHLLYDRSVMPCIWNAVAMRDTKLLRHMFEEHQILPKQYVFVNELKNEKEIQWDLDYEFLKNDEITEKDHRAYLNNFFRGYEGYSNSRGKICQCQDETEGICGTTASLCGLEKAVYEQSEQQIEKAIRLEIMLYACLFMKSGLPVISSGDEIGLLNDYSHGNYGGQEDFCCLQRGKFDWNKAAKVVDEYSIEGKIMRELNKIENVKKSEAVFGSLADIRAIDIGDDSVFCVVREYNGEKILGIFNFSENERTLWKREKGVKGSKGEKQEKDIYEDLINGKKIKLENMKIEGYGFYYLKRQPVKN